MPQETSANLPNELRPPTFIKFGTDGWRAIIGEDYTFDNVRACAAERGDVPEEAQASPIAA